MGRVTFIGAGIAMAFVVTACGGSTSGSGPSGSGGSVGSGGNGAGGGSGTSPGTASIEFRVSGAGSYCMTSTCGQGPAVDIEDASGHSLFTIAANCTSVSCETCTTSPCPGFACQVSGISVSGASLVWDGSYNVNATCGAGTSCVKGVYASPGKYTAKMCATPGNLTGPDGGDQQCTNTGPAKCGSVEFDFPSSTVVKGTVGP